MNRLPAWPIFKTRKALALGLAVIASSAGVLYVVLQQWVWSNSLPEGLIQANGRLEGDRITVASKFPGRIHRRLVREGDTVEKGRVLVELDDAQARARVEQASQAWASLESQFQAAHTELAVLNLEVPLSIEAADNRVEEARATVDKAIAVEKEARLNVERYRELVAKQFATKQQLDQAEARWDVARNEIKASRAALARTTRELAQAELGWKRIRAKEAQVEALERQRDQAEAALEEAESNLADLTIVAPSDGTITTRFVDVGQVVTAGTPLFEMVDLDRLYLKVYVPEVYIGKVRLGVPARVYTDAFPDTPFPAVVRYIASRAEFTPKEVQTPDERVKLTYAVKLYLDANPEHRLTPGLPADAVIRWKEGAPWAKPKW